jgi:hypothetical protein
MKEKDKEKAYKHKGLSFLSTTRFPFFLIPSLVLDFDGNKILFLKVLLCFALLSVLLAHEYKRYIYEEKYDIIQSLIFLYICGLSALQIQGGIIPIAIGFGIQLIFFFIRLKIEDNIFYKIEREGESEEEENNEK